MTNAEVPHEHQWQRIGSGRICLSCDAAEKLNAGTWGSWPNGAVILKRSPRYKGKAES